MMVDGWLGIAIQGLDYLCHGHPTRRFLGFTQWNSMVFPSLNSMGSYPSFHHGISSWLISSRSFWLQNLQIITTDVHSAPLEKAVTVSNGDFKFPFAAVVLGDLLMFGG